MAESKYGSEDVVEVMSDPTGQLADGLIFCACRRRFSNCRRSLTSCMIATKWETCPSVARTGVIVRSPV
jgi:hypothetical protein